MGLTLAVIDRHDGDGAQPGVAVGRGGRAYTSLARWPSAPPTWSGPRQGESTWTRSSSTREFGSHGQPAPSIEVMAVIDDLRDRGRVVGRPGVSHVS